MRHLPVSNCPSACETGGNKQHRHFRDCRRNLTEARCDVNHPDRPESKAQGKQSQKIDKSRNQCAFQINSIYWVRWTWLQGSTLDAMARVLRICCAGHTPTRHLYQSRPPRPISDGQLRPQSGLWPHLGMRSNWAGTHAPAPRQKTKTPAGGGGFSSLPTRRSTAAASARSDAAFAALRSPARWRRP